MGCLGGLSPTFCGLASAAVWDQPGQNAKPYTGNYDRWRVYCGQKLEMTIFWTPKCTKPTFSVTLSQIPLRESLQHSPEHTGWRGNGSLPPFQRPHQDFLCIQYITFLFLVGVVFANESFLNLPLPLPGCYLFSLSFFFFFFLHFGFVLKMSCIPYCRSEQSELH